MEAEIKIGGISVDIDSQESLRLSLSYSIADIVNISTSNSAFSKSITLPGTAKNDKLFGFTHDPSSAVALTQNTRPDAQVLIGGTVIIDGFAKITKAVNKNKSNTHQYQFRITGDNGVWKQQLEEESLQELDYSLYNHVWNSANILLSEFILDNKPEGSLDDRTIVYPIINYGLEQDAPVVNQNSGKVGLRVEDRYLAFHVKTLIEKMFKKTGFKITSSFFDSDFFNGLYMPFTKDNLLEDEAQLEIQKFRAGMTAQQEFTTPSPFPQFTSFTGQLVDFDNDSGPGFFDNGNNFDITTQQFIVGSSGLQKFTFEITMETTLQDNVFFVQNIMKNQAVGVSVGVTLATQSRSIDIIDGKKRFTVTTPFVEVTAGDTIVCNLLAEGRIDVASGLFIGVSTGFFGTNGTFFNDTKLSTVREGSFLDVALQLPDVNQLTFLQAIRDEFNLLILTNVKQREVFIEPRDQFYRTKAVDFTKRLDKGKDEQVSFLNTQLPSILTYRYQNDGNDKVVQEIEKQTEEVFASHEFETTNKFAKGEGNKTVRLFAPTLMDTFENIGFITQRVPRLHDEIAEPPTIPLRSTKFEMRLLNYNGLTALPVGEDYEFDGVSFSSFPWMYSVDEISDNDRSLYWNDTRRSVGLFSKYWKNTHRTLDEGILYTCRLYLTPAHINNLINPTIKSSLLDFRQPVFIDGTYYLWNKIFDYDPLNVKSTKCELVKPINMDIKAIIDELNQPIFPPPPIDPTSPTVLEVIDPDVIATPPLDYPPNTGYTQVGKDGGVVSGGTGNQTDSPGATQYGERLHTSRPGQVAMGRYNEFDDNARFMVGGGSPGERNTIMKVAFDGTVKSGNGSAVRITINGISHPMTYTDKLGEEQPLVKEDLKQRTPGSGPVIEGEEIAGP